MRTPPATLTRSTTRTTIMALAAVIMVGAFTLGGANGQAEAPKANVKAIEMGALSGTTSGETLPIVRNGESVLPISAIYKGAPGLTGALSLTLALPADLSVVRASTFLPQSPTTSAQWACRSESPGVVCDLMDSKSPGTPYPLPPEQPAQIYLVLRGGESIAAPAPADAPVALGDVTIAVSAPTANATLEASTAVSASAVAGPLPPRINAVIPRLDPTAGSETTGFDLVVINVGGTATSSSRAHSSVRLANLLPIKYTAAVRATGRGWRCSGLIDASCTYSRRVDPGVVSALLSVRWPVKNDLAALAETWTIAGTAGYSGSAVFPPTDTASGGAPPVPGEVPFESHMTIKRLRAIVQLSATASATNGVSITSGGATRDIATTIVNTGVASATSVGMTVGVPAGVTITSRSAEWSCTGAVGTYQCSRAGPLARNATTTLAMRVLAADAKTQVSGTMTFTPLGPTGTKAGSAIALPIRVIDAGDPRATPTIWLQTRGTWREWTDGSTLTTPARDRFTYRIALVNRGGVDLPAGTTTTLTQTFGPGVVVDSVTPPPGATCTSRTSVSCVIPTPTSVATGKQIGQVQVTLRIDKPTERATVGAIAARVAGELASESIPMRVRVVDNPNSLRPAQALKVIPTAGGTGALVMVVQNRAGGAVQGLRASTVLPAGMTAESVQGGGWDCTARERRLDCSYARVVGGGKRTSGIGVRFRTQSRSATQYSIAWNASAIQMASGTRQRGMRKGQMPLRGPIAIRATASPQVITPVTATANAASRVVSLDGSASHGNGVALSYTWRQRCLGADDAASLSVCAGRQAPRASIPHPHVGTTKATIPAVARRTNFVFELRLTDGSATLTRLVTVTAAVPSKLSRRVPAATTGVTSAAAQARTARATAARAAAAARANTTKTVAASRRRTARLNASAAKKTNALAPGVRNAAGTVITAARGARVELAATTTGRTTGSRRYEWTQVAGDPVPLTDAASPRAAFTAPDASTTLAFRVATTDSGGNTSISQVLVAVDTQASRQFTALASSAVTAAARKRPLIATFGTGAKATFVTVSDLRSTSAVREAQANTGFAFGNSTIAVGAITITKASGTTTATGVTITQGSLSTPSSWGLRPIAIGSTSPITLVFGSAPGAPVDMFGEVTAKDDFGLLPLPDGWSGSTTLSFTGDTSRIAATAVGDGAGSVSLAGSITTGGNYDAQVTATGLVHVGGAVLDLAGRVTNTPGEIQSTVSASAGPIALVDGVTLSSLSATWMQGIDGGVAVRGTGGVEIRSGADAPITISSQLNYRSRLDWSLTLTGQGGGAWSPIPGLTLKPSDFSGTIGLADGGWSWKATGHVARWNATKILTLSDVVLSISDQCQATTIACPSGSTFLAISANATIDPTLVPAITTKATAVIGLGDGGGFALAASVGDLHLAPGITLTRPSFSATYGMPEDSIPSTIGAPTFERSTENGFSMIISANVAIPGIGSFTSIAANVTSEGWALGAYDADGVEMGTGNGAQTNAYLGWTSFDTSMTMDVPGFGPRTVPLQRGSVVIAGGYEAPSWFAKLVGGGPGRTFGTLQFDPASGYFSASIAIPASFSLPAGGTKIEMTAVTFRVVNNSLGVQVSVAASAEMETKGNGGTASPTPTLTLTMAYDVTTTNVQASLSFTDPAGWKDAFGVDGLVVREASFTLMVNITTMIPGLKLLAAADLPKSITGPFKVPDAGVPVVVGAELSATNPCIDIQVGSTEGTQTVLSVGGGAVSAKYFEFIIAPTGCQLSPESAPIPPGYQMAFDGTILGVDVDVSASLGLAPTTFDATATIGPMSVAGLQLHDTSLRVSLDPEADNSYVALSGGMKMFGSDITVSGDLARDGSTTSGNLKMSQTGSFDVAGFHMTDMMVDVGFQTGPESSNVSVNAAGKVNIMGSEVDVNQFAVEIDNGVVEEVAFSIDTTVKINGVGSATGTFDMDYSSSTGRFDLNAAVVLSTTTGFKIGSAEKPATLAISPDCVAFNGDLAMGEMFTANLSGTIIYTNGCTQQVQDGSGQLVSGRASDFSFAASDVKIQLAGFSTTGAVAIGKVGDDIYTKVQAPITLGPQGAQADAEVTGAFQSNGDFSLTGTSKLALAGFVLDVNVVAMSQGPNSSVTGSTEMSLAGNAVEVEGDFQNRGGAVYTTLTGSIPSLSIDGFSTGKAKVVVTQSPTASSVMANVAMKVGSAATGQIAANGDITFIQDQNDVRFYASLASSMGFPSIGTTMTGYTTFTNCTDSSCAESGPATFVLNGSLGAEGFTFAPTVSMSSNGDFQATATVAGNACSGTVKLVALLGQACFNYNVNLFIGSMAPYAALSASASANVQIQEWDASPWNKPWKWGWGRWHSYGENVGADISLSPFKICVNVIGSDLCV